MFTKPCFIRKNTPELRKKLEELGYRTFKSLADNVNDGNVILTTLVYHYEVVNDVNDTVKNNRIDCGQNEVLFLAIASLKSFSDINQWFIMDAEVYVDIPKGSWFKATDIGEGKHIGTQIDPMYCHKATVEELIRKFTSFV